MLRPGRMSSKGAGVSVHHAGSGNLAPLCLTMRWGNSSSQVMIELCEGGVFVMVVKCVCVWGGVGGCICGCGCDVCSAVWLSII